MMMESSQKYQISWRTCVGGWLIFSIFTRSKYSFVGANLMDFKSSTCLIRCCGGMFGEWGLNDTSSV